MGYYLVGTCDAIVEDPDFHWCRKPGVWLAKWSDRESVACREHRDDVYQCYLGDHSYDQTGLEWQMLSLETNDRIVTSVYESDSTIKANHAYIETDDSKRD